MLNKTLFELPEPEPKRNRKPAGKRAAPRLRKADRMQVRLLPTSLDALLPEDHKARAVWAYVERLDLSTLRESIRAVEGSAGRPSTDPRILLALWLYATIDGVGSARAPSPRSGRRPERDLGKAAGSEEEGGNRGLRQFSVRGLKAAKSVALLFAIAHNLARAITLLA